MSSKKDQDKPVKYKKDGIIDYHSKNLHVSNLSVNYQTNPNFILAAQKRWSQGLPLQNGERSQVLLLLSLLQEVLHTQCQNPIIHNPERRGLQKSAKDPFQWTTVHRLSAIPLWRQQQQCVVRLEVFIRCPDQREEVFPVLQNGGGAVLVAHEFL